MPSQPLRVLTYIDAAFATHADSKSHSGITVFVAGVLVYSSSRKQACVTKRPTESELVALSDNRTVRDFYSPGNFFAYVAWYRKADKKITTLKFAVGYIELCSQSVQLLTQ
jgi:hypothetical protein